MKSTKILWREGTTGINTITNCVGLGGTNEKLIEPTVDMNPPLTPPRKHYPNKKSGHVSYKHEFLMMRAKLIPQKFQNFQNSFRIHN